MMKSSRRAIIFRIILVYFLLSVVWITSSDYLLFQLVKDPDLARTLSIYKGWGFVVITAVLLGVLLYRELRNLEAAHARLEASEQRFRLLYQDAPLPALALDTEGRILLVNQLWCETLGFTPLDATGQLFTRFVAPSAREHFEHAYNDFVDSGHAGYTGELDLQRADGSILLTAVTGRRVNDPAASSPISYFTLQNITGQRQLEVENRLQQEEYRRILDAVPALVYYIDRAQVIVRVNQAAAEQQHTSPAELIGKPVKSIFPSYTDWIDDSFTDLMASGKPVLGKNYETTNAEGQPMWVQVDRIPYMGVDGRQEGVVAFVTDVTDQVRRERDLESLVDLSTALRGVNNREDLLSNLLQLIMDNLHVEGASIALRSNQDENLVIQAAAGRWQSLTGRVINDQGMSQRVTASGQAELTQQVAVTDSIDGKPYRDEIRAAGAVPLIAERQTLGALWIGSRSPIPEDDFRLLRTMADIAAAALHRILVADQTQLRLRRVSALHYIDMAISASFDWHVTLNVLLSQAIAMLGVDAAAILTFNPETQYLEYAAGIGFLSGAESETRLRLGESQAGAVALKREIRFIADLRELDDPSFESFISREEFTTFCSAPLIGKGQVKGVVELFTRARFTPDGEWMDFLEMLTAQAAIALDNSELFEGLQQSNSELRQAYDALILGWSRALELRDAETQGHANRLVEHTLRLARRLHLPERDLPHLRRGVLLHDIGKMGIPDAVLLKPGVLTPLEWQVMRQHPVYAYDLLSSIAYLRPAIEVPYAHHEHWDGSGYPRGLKGEGIPFTARIFSVVDVWDALTHDRPYRRAWTEAQAEAYLREQAGVTLDPRVVAEFLAMLQEEEQT